MGGISFFLFLVLAFTGVLLMFYYVPTEEEGYFSIKDLVAIVPFGKVWRNIHFWAGQGMVVTVIWHMIRVFYTGAYQRPRALNWLVGILLFLLTLFSDFTGYLLRWDQDSFWAVTVCTQLLKAVPLIGSQLHQLIVGEENLGSIALLRFYVFHCLLFPCLLIILSFYHFWRIRRDGRISGPL